MFIVLTMICLLSTYGGAAGFKGEPMVVTSVVGAHLITNSAEGVQHPIFKPHLIDDSRGSHSIAMSKMVFMPNVI